MRSPDRPKFLGTAINANLIRASIDLLLTSVEEKQPSFRAAASIMFRVHLYINRGATIGTIIHQKAGGASSAVFSIAR